MHRTLLLLTVVSACVLLHPQRANALEPANRNGVFLGFGLGVGNATWNWGLDLDNSPNEVSGTLHLRAGTALRRDLVVGLEFAAWVKDYDLEAEGAVVGDARASFSATTLAATWFPGNLGWYLRGGLGLALAHGKADFGLPGFGVRIDNEERGIALLGATGFELRLTRRFAVGPEVELFYLGMSGDGVDDIVVVDGAMEFTWYW